MLRLNLVAFCLFAAAYALGLAAFPPEFTTRDVNHQLFLVTGLAAWVLMAECLVIAARPAWIERAAGVPLDRLARAHRTLGWACFAAVALHCLAPFIGGLLPARPVPMMDEHVMDTFWQAVWIWLHPIGALTGILATLWALRVVFADVSRARGKLAWDAWERIHRGWAWVFLALALHSLRLMKETEMIMPLGWLNAAVTAAGCWAAASILLRRPGSAKRTQARVSASRREGDLLLLSVSTPLAAVARPGQFAYLSLPADTEDPHPFTVTGSDPSRGELSFWIRVSGDWTRRLASLAPGEPLRAEGPWGSFVPDWGTPGAQLWIAGGIGIAPFIAWLSEAAARRAAGGEIPRITLLWSVHDAQGQPGLGLVRAACEKAGATLRVHGSAALGRLDPERAIGEDTALLAACGKPAMVRALGAAWRRSGRPASRFRAEEY